MKRLIRLTESDLHNIVKNSVTQIIREMAGDGANSTFGVNSAAGSLSDPTGQQKNHIDVPFGKVQRRKVYSPKSSAGGDVTKQKENTVDMTPGTKRSKDFKNGSMMMRHVGDKEK